MKISTGAMSNLRPLSAVTFKIKTSYQICRIRLEFFRVEKEEVATEVELIVTKNIFDSKWKKKDFIIGRDHNIEWTR